MPIEAVRPGDRVWACDLETGDWSLRRVADQWGHEDDGVLVDVEVGGETITATGGHPFWVTAGERLADRPIPDHIPPDERDLGCGWGRWVGAADLRPGDLLGAAGGAAQAVTRVVHRPGPAVVYNLHVDGLHTFAVGAAGVLVHNQGATQPIQNRLMEKAQRAAARARGQAVPPRAPTRFCLLNRRGAAVPLILHAPPRPLR
ncbi:MAG: HINT domain-containing protein, partial [Gemmataceae bacterium]|nr:HINT domain-containing protein [Gemmataceae bacterium]